MSLANKHILLGITGSIAAYKSPDLVRRLKEAGAIVRVVMTHNAKQFITPLTLQAVSGYPVHDDLFDLTAEAAMGHIELARWADMVLIAPASASCIARLAQGQADDLLTTLCLATKAPLVLAPAMNQGMWQHPTTKENCVILENKKTWILDTAQGSQACGDTGPGRMMEPIDIVSKVSTLFETGVLAGLRVVITAGPTREPIDPIRFLSNGSSGKMGYALAEAAQEAGAAVTVISGPVDLQTPADVKRIAVNTAAEMYAEAMKATMHCDIFIGVAAVADYFCQNVATQKIHKNDLTLRLELTRTPDIISAVAQQQPKPFVVGFAAETEDVLTRAEAKRVAKKMDMIIANQITAGIGIGSDENVVTVLSAGSQIPLPKATKQQLARQLVAMIATSRSRL
ncbi:MAG TPA: bifunctional phosphopantothenoylcysteine decarboxylase/phosphopantothenate--cysteine ligase CoaBC [Gammaproteobacteria bacterium]|jgi:phosphopantothenoylcysteine decarboxylase/phosphopantothenate--cysteine ligase|nr:bifunctional phosphopantothenoylcysteine decarboxylase/phosphopantothenate--cysteine ligase CoaBC [Gammaproteobacteria bacterium]